MEEFQAILKVNCMCTKYDGTLHKLKRFCKNNGFGEIFVKAYKSWYKENPES